MITSELYDIIHNGDLSKARAWLEARPQDLNADISEGLTPLHVACLFGAEQIAYFLIDRLALVNMVAANAAETTALHLAVGYREEEVAARLVNTLVAHGAELNAKQAGGLTALHHAVARGSLKLVTELITLGADPFLKDHQKTSAADLARRLQEGAERPAQIAEIREALKGAFSLPLEGS